ncbi:GNAT family N-acetyltransferase [Brucella tritici]|jgi:GNAT superfamily N-acetyltransferase|uniref:GNAT family N-acetyltransferase n=1 Tax=Brucella tritici TaxID=94626 RepID=A0A7V8B0Z5_9HYPH|nr:MULTISPECIES: GNAT family N-acetyltransferase [Brucella]KAB2655273.1 GNAT family N-acetyltransferase [Brucella tritici]KXO77733.1 GCN5 family acetyltransferase [Brucella anthropi]
MLQIVSLADRPDLIPVCAAWNHAEWGEFTGSSLAQTAEAFSDISREDDGQVARVALWNGQPAGLALLIHSDLETHPHLKPWVASVFVAPDCRGKGIARSLVGAIEDAARELGYAEAYLYTDKPDLYRRIGWSDFEHLEGDYAGMLILEKKIAR